MVQRALRDAVGAALSGRRDGPRRVRDTLAELGPTFVKLGQVLSTRPDLVPPRLEVALATLQDDAPALAAGAVRLALRRELGRDPASVFAELDDAPLAAASIGQVHAATLHDGRRVVVKVRRPGVTAAVEEDLAVLRLGASLVARVPGSLRRVDVVGFVEQFAETIRGELDYVAEGHNADRARQDLSDLPVHVPAVVWEATSHGALTLERIDGVKIDDLDGLARIGADRPALARTLAYLYLSMVFSHGFFHADPHPGNLFVEPGGRIALVDFGMVGTVGAGVRHALVEIVLALVSHDTRRTVAAMRGLGVAPAGVDEETFVTELDRLTAASIEIPVGELRLAPLVADLMTVSRRHRLAFPRELALLVKTVVMCEGLAALLDPGFALPEVLVRFALDAFGGAAAPAGQADP
ncbi:MAG TPA: AarF/UbiB family protein [Acidimicrobiales bacterium]|nr:AarF/UbiB family protein [Acidimicrobiales bacterium]